MMKIIPIKITLLSHFFNYCRLTNAGAITSDFIGDIALTYALNRVLKIENFYLEFHQQPEYHELRKLPYFFTVAKPLVYEFTPVYIRNTLFNVDGYPDLNAIDQSGRTPFKNFFKVQGIRAESIFLSYLLCREDFRVHLPMTIRLGTGRESLTLLEETESDDTDDVWLNVYSLKYIFGNFEKAVQLIPFYQFEFRLQNYLLWKGVSVVQLESLFKDIYE